MRKQNFQKVALFIVIAGLIGGVSGFIEGGIKVADACSMYDSYGCGSYAPSNYGGYNNYWPYMSTSVGCGATCGGYGYGAYDYGYDNWDYGYNDYGYGGYDYGCGTCGGGYGGYGGGYNYQPFPSYQYVYNQQPARAPVMNNYVQYPYYEYVYFQNPGKQNSQNSTYADTYNYVQYPYQQYPYQQYVYNR
jgi:hypothetical protein